MKVIHKLDDNGNVQWPGMVRSSVRISLLLACTRIPQLFLMLAVAVTAATAAASQSSNLLHFSRISASPPITKSPWYVAPADVEPRFTRAASKNPHPTQPYSSYPYHHSQPHHHYAQQQLQQYSSPSSQIQYDHHENNNNNNNDNVRGITSEVDAYFAAAQRQHDKRNEALRHDEQQEHASAAEEYATVPSVLEPQGDDTPNARIYDQRFHDDEYSRIREASKQQEKTIVKGNPKHCRTEYKNDMECIVCKNPKSGSHSQQCSFSSTAPKKKYAYTKERNFQSPTKGTTTEDNEQNSAAAEDDANDSNSNNDGGDDDDSSEEEETTTPPPPPRPKKSKKSGYKKHRSPSSFGGSSNGGRNAAHHVEQFRPSLQTTNTQRISSSEWQPVPDTLRFRGYAAQSSELHPYVVDLEPFLYGVRASESLASGAGGGLDADNQAGAGIRHAKRDTKKDENDGSSYDGFSFERFFARDFPEAKSAGLIRAVKDGADKGNTGDDDIESDDEDENDNDDRNDDGPDATEFVPDYRNQNVERALAAFKQRDWSKCEKSKRDELTCYVCYDENGVRHEECMYEAGRSDEPSDDDDHSDNAKKASLVSSVGSPTSRSHLSYTETKEYHSADAHKKPTGFKKQKRNDSRSERLQIDPAETAAADDDISAAASYSSDAPGSRKTHTKLRKVSVKRRTVSQQRTGRGGDRDDGDVGEHQAQASTRFVKRMTADVGDATVHSNVNNSDPASPPPTTSSSSSLLTTSTHSAATTTVEAYEIHDDDDDVDGDAGDD